MDTEWWHRVVHYLGYTQHGGSGLGWSRSEILDADLIDIIRAVEQLSAARKAESAALEEAHRPHPR